MKSYLEMGGETEHGTGKCRNESQGGGSGRGKLTCASTHMETITQMVQLGTVLYSKKSRKIRILIFIYVVPKS